MGPDELTAQDLLAAYAGGIFPMAEHRDDPELFWVEPRRRGILPLDGFHISRSLRRRIRAEPFEISFSRDFSGVVAGCAERPETWISDRLTGLYGELFRMRRAHSIELWEGEALVGGVFGISLGGAFFGESMFSRRRDASKIALAFLVDRLRQGGFALFDTQFLTRHLASLGAQEVTRQHYRELLKAALAEPALFDEESPAPVAQLLLQRSTQIS